MPKLTCAQLEIPPVFPPVFVKESMLGPMNPLFAIIYEDDDLLVINKPAGLVCHPTKGDEYSSLISRVRLHLGAQTTAHLINRLDRETSGVVLAAKNSATAGELGKILESRAVEKEYLAIVHGHVTAEQGTIDAPLGKDEQSRVAVKDCVRLDGAPSQTDFKVERRFWGRPRPSQASEVCIPSPVQESGIVRSLETSSAPEPANDSPSPGGEGRGEGGRSHFPQELESSGPSPHALPVPFTLLHITPRTGRKHQIRIHLAHIGHPLVGDKIYGGDEDLYLALVENRLTPEQRARLILENHALHARALRFDWRGRPHEFACPSEPAFATFADA